MGVGMPFGTLLSPLTMLTIKELTNLLQEGPVADIFRAERDFAIMKKIGEHAE
jgi:hypothetical protein